MNDRLLRIVDASEARAQRTPPVDPGTLAAAAEIVEAVRAEGEPAVRRFAARFDGLGEREPLLIERDALLEAPARIAPEDRAALERAAGRLGEFATAQRESARDFELSIDGGRAGQTSVPVDRAGCYAPGGRYPLPSSVLMTAVTARVAGCREVVVCSPSADDRMLAAAAIAGADAYLRLGGAHAVGAMAYGFDGFAPCDLIGGPGNRWVTAAKQLVFGVVGIDMLAGPSELLVIADGDADPGLVAADLLAQAEHDADASTVLVALDPALPDAVERELRARLETLPTADTARRALANGFAVVVGSVDEALRVSDAVAPEHLQIATRDAGVIAQGVRHAGAVFVGERSAEVFGDYGAGPNHTLPTGGSARFAAGLSVHTFLRRRTWLAIDDADSQAPDAARIARMEGLEAHARAGEARVTRVGTG